MEMEGWKVWKIMAFWSLLYIGVYTDQLLMRRGDSCNLLVADGGG
jgi:hypothetical protein